MCFPEMSPHQCKMIESFWVQVPRKQVNNSKLNQGKILMSTQVNNKSYNMHEITNHALSIPSIQPSFDGPVHLRDKGISFAYLCTALSPQTIHRDVR